MITNKEGRGEAPPDSGSNNTWEQLIDRECLWLKEVINRARGEDPKAAVPEKGTVWGNRLENLASAALARRLIAVRDHRKPRFWIVYLDELWRFALKADHHWKWLRDFCKRWYAVRDDLPPTIGNLGARERKHEAVAKHPGGRPPKYDRDSFVQELLRLANTPDGLPDRPLLFSQMADWCSENWNEIPVDSTIRAWISNIYPPNKN